MSRWRTVAIIHRGFWLGFVLRPGHRDMGGMSVTGPLRWGGCL